MAFLKKLHWQILIALLLSILAAVVLKSFSENNEFVTTFSSMCAFVGKLFMNALKMVVIPLIVASIIHGMTGLCSEKNVGRIGIKVLGYYAFSGLFAILIGLLMVNLLKPGIVDPELAQKIVGQAERPESFMAKIEGRGADEMLAIFLRMLPPNIVNAAVQGNFLGLIVFSLLFGAFINQLPDHLRQTQNSFWKSTQQVMLGITNLIIKFAPIGVFGLVTPILIRTGFGLFSHVLVFLLTVLAGLAIHALITLSILLKLVGRVSPRLHLKTMFPALLTAFSTASSSATLPVTLETVKIRAGVSDRTSSFTLPLGATVNMDGTALYECVVVVFIAQIYSVLYGFEIGFMTQFTVVLLALLTSVGVAGIPSASLVAIAVILGAVGLPLEAVGIVWVTDRILDMCRTAINVYSDTCGAVIIGKTEGETEIYKTV